MALSDTAIRNLKAPSKPTKIWDERGLFLLLTPSGGKLWRFKYRFDGKEKLLALGGYPDVPLAKARERRDEARRLLTDEIDPGAHRKLHKEARADLLRNTFEAVAREWYSREVPVWAPTQAKKITGILEKDLFPWLSSRVITEITAPELLGVVRRIEERGAVETARRALQCCGQILRYAIATGRASVDVTPNLKGALTKSKTRHHPAITAPAKVGELMRAIEGYSGTFTVRCALKLGALTFVRPGELRKAEWSEIDLKLGVWNLPAERMKMKEPHLVPLARQALSVLRELHPLTGHGRYVFPGERSHDRPMSENSVNAALRRLGYSTDEMTGHGFRAMARTLLDEVLGVRPDYIEHQLAHAVRDPNGRAYNRTAHLEARKEMMQRWADYLDELRELS